MKNKKNIHQSILKKINFSRVLNLIDLKSKEKKDIFRWIVYILFINAIIMWLNPVSINNTYNTENTVFIVIIDILFKLILNSLVFISLGIFLFLFKRHNILFSIYSIIWVGLGLTNHILMEIRSNPLTKYDFTMLSEGMNLGKSFLNNSHYFKIAIFIIFSITLIMMSISSKKNSKKYKLKNIALTYISITIINTALIDISSTWSNNHINNYSKIGFVYAFTENITTKDIKKPRNYKKTVIKDIKTTIDKKYNNKNDYKKPNILAIQLESFFDIKTIDGLSFNENPTPYFDELRKKYTSGLVKVPTIGGGTARSEFEFITGLNMKYMKSGLIPHNSFLKEGPYISSVYALKNSGYKTHLLHNFAGYFYNRDIVYNNLGFDTFTSLEFLNNASDNPSVIKASKDNIFPTELKKILESTEDKDFIFGITTQLHGNYEEDYSKFENNIIVKGNFNKSQLSQMNDYANELKSIDNVIKDIISTIENLKEPTIIIFYSDHKPPLNYENTNIKGEAKYLVPYVVWDNIGLEKDDKDINLYELLSKYMNLAGIEGNYLNKLQSININNEEKDMYQELLQYDISVGKNYIGETLLPYKVDTKLGIDSLIIENIKKDGITYTIKGSGFTSSMVLVVDDAECGILFEDSSTVKLVTNLDLTNKGVYLKIKIGQNEKSIVKSNTYTLK